MTERSSVRTLTAQIGARSDNDWVPSKGPETCDLLKHVFQDKDDSRAVKQVISASISILSRCISPTSTESEVSTTGLVVGHVQSGKTLSFTTVSALARDNSFHIVIVMTGISKPLFEQSTGRLRADLRLDAHRDRKWNFLSNPRANQDLNSLRDIINDWHDQSVPSDQKVTALITVMKNHQHLANLRDLLSQLDLKHSPVLIIDDEADQASMNTKVKRNDESTTYRRIGELREQAPHHSFLQYTATPQAPLLISLIDVLSPSFVQILQPGSGYVGGREFFIDHHNTHIREIPVFELQADPEEESETPDSLLQALRVFMVGVASSMVLSNTRGNRSMLVHPSHRTDRHSVYTGWVQRVKSNWESILNHSDSDAAQELLEDFREAYQDIHRTEPNLPEFDAIRKKLPRAIRLTRVQEVNARGGSTPSIPWANHYSWILIAGQAVDRGFTVEGLTVTYMPRSIGVGNADTLQQRGRFFGYKQSYLGYCRIYLPQTVIDAFSDYVAHEEDVRSQLQEYQEPGRDLNEWKRAFIMSPMLSPTRQNVLQLDYMRGLISNSWLDPSYPLGAPDAIEANRGLVSNFLDGLQFLPDEGHPDRTPVQRHLLAQDVRLETVLQDLLVPYRIPTPSDSQKFTGLLLQLRRAIELTPNELCSVYWMSPHETRRRSLKAEGRISNLFQGANPAKKNGQGSVYPGDRELHHPNRVTIQLHILTLMDQQDNIQGENVPVIAVWIPSRLAAGWIVQDDYM